MKWISTGLKKYTGTMTACMREFQKKKKKNKMCWQLSQLQIAKLEAGTGNKRLMQDTPEKSFNGQPYDAANCNIKGQA